MFNKVYGEELVFLNGINGFVVEERMLKMMIA